MARKLSKDIKPVTVGQLKEMLKEWPDDSQIDIWLTAVPVTKDNILSGYPTLGGRITSVDLQVENPEGAPYVMICGVMYEYELEELLEEYG